MRTIRLLAISSPAPATEEFAAQCEIVYAVASDETFWCGEYKKGAFAWKEMPTIPQPEPPHAD